MRQNLHIGLLAALGMATSATLGVAQDVKAGWSVDLNKPKRAVLSYAAEDNGPRLLIVGCMRDSEEFGLYSAGIMAGATTRGGILSMQLVNGGAKYTVRGEPGVDANNQPAFRYETNIDSRALGLIRNDLMPIFNGKGPIVVTIGKEERKIPVAGLAEPLKKFSAACFGR